VATADGHTYDMGNPKQRQACADSNMVHYTSQCSNMAHSIAAKLLVTVGMFTFQAVGKHGPNGLEPQGGDERYPFRPTVLLNATIASTGVGFVDVHVYPVGGGWAMGPDLASSELQPGRQAVEGGPALFMGETGAFRKFFASATQAAPYFYSLLHDSCDWGFTGAT
jgi:hypothetical protein